MVLLLYSAGVTVFLMLFFIVLVLRRVLGTLTVSNLYNILYFTIHYLFL